MPTQRSTRGSWPRTSLLAVVLVFLAPVGIASGGEEERQNELPEVVHMEVDEDGNGSVAVGATIAWNEETLRISIGVEGIEPLRMTSVRKVQ